MRIPFYPLADINRLVEEELLLASRQVIQSGAYILGRQVQQFEEAFAKFCGAQYAIGVSSGLDALYVSLKAYETIGFLKAGDEVIVPSHTYIASILAILKAGMVPVMVEPDMRTYTINAAQIEQKITVKTKVIMLVHLYGQACEMQGMQALVDKYGVKILEDGSQAQGACFDGKMVGNLGDCAGISLFPSKNLGALGDAGVVTTSDENMADVIASLRNYGSKVKYYHQHQGDNLRLDEMQAAFLRVKLQYLQDWNQKRVAVANRYLQKIENPAVMMPVVAEKCTSVWHQFVIRHDKRDLLQQYLKAKGVDTLIHYPVAIHQQACFKQWQGLHLPRAEEIAKTCLSLPIHNVLTGDEVDYIANVINDFR